MNKLTAKEFENFFTYFKGQEQQVDAVRQLYALMPDSILQPDSSWIVRYRETPPKSDGIPQAAVNLIKEFEGFRSSVLRRRRGRSHHRLRRHVLRKRHSCHVRRPADH